MMTAITGTPGTGKTSAARIAARSMGLTHLDLNSAVKDMHLYKGYDAKRKSYIADMKKVREYVMAFERKNRNVLIDGHLSHLLPEKLLDSVIVLRCEPSALKKRLEKRRWNRLKVEENREAEFIGIIPYEARERHRNVFEVDTTGKSVGKVAQEIEAILKGGGAKYRKRISWMD